MLTENLTTATDSSNRSNRADGRAVSLTDVELTTTAEMARLRLADGERSSLRAAIEQILGYFDQMQDIDVSEVEPTSHPAVTASNPRLHPAPLRQDRAVDSAARWRSAETGALVQRATETEEGFIITPHVF